MRINPFRALRPCQDLVDRVASVPYDVVSRTEACALARDNPMSFLHVSRAEIDLPENIAPYAPEVYAKAAANFAALQERGVLIRASRPCVYVYRLRRNGRYQHGIAACCHVGDYANSVIKKHERTRIEKEEDRKKHTIALRAHSGPVFLTYRDRPEIDSLIRATEEQPPLYDFTAPDGVEHAVWPAKETAAFIEAFKQVPAAYIADGHHRAAAAAAVARELGQANADENAEFNWFLAVLFPAGQLEILAYNRCVRDLAGMDSGRFLEEVRKYFIIEQNVPRAPAEAGRINMYLDKSWFGLHLKKMPPSDDPAAALDVSLLQNQLFDKILGIKDPRTDSRLEFIGGIHGPQELENRVNSGNAAAAFSMYPTGINQLLAISDAGRTMPPKSTWFEPKLRDALLIHTF
ncbi:MAG: DUF1015 family protein [Kiritimatiellae bacterium]|nr:DUF1015 family protein [Kiritimatiellia bacterium]